MPFVTAETTVRGVTAAVVTGTLAQWRDAVAAGSVREAEPSVRAGFNKVYGLFCGAGLNVWGDYRAREAPDRTLSLGIQTAMKPYYAKDNITIYCGDNREVLPTLPVAWCDFACTDPPYSALLHGHRVGSRCSRRPGYWRDHSPGFANPAH